MKSTVLIGHEAQRLLLTASNGKREIFNNHMGVHCASITYTAPALEELVKAKFAVPDTHDMKRGTHRRGIFKTTKKGRAFASKIEIK